MTEQQERLAEAAVVRACLAGDRAAWEELAFYLALAVTLCLARCRHSAPRRLEGVIEDAGQQVVYRLLQREEEVLGRFDPQAGPLAGYLARFVWQEARHLDRADRRAHRRERAAVRAEVTQPEAKVDWERLVRHALPHLTPRLRDVLTAVMQGKRLGEDLGLSGGQVRQTALRIRRMLAEAHDLRGPPGKNRKNSGFL
jgi:RNA polymerase sigma factor (sigma-70 family)